MLFTFFYFINYLLYFYKKQADQTKANRHSSVFISKGEKAWDF